jgi:predicted ferric reductase
VSVDVSPRIAAPRVDLEHAAETDAAWRDALETAFWLAGVGALSLMLAAGQPVSTLGDALTGIGRATGIVAATMMMVQLLVIARIPVIERRLGHDRAALLHGRLGRIGFVMMAAHVITLVLGYGARVKAGWWDQAWSFALHYGDEMTLAVIGFWLLIAVVATSLAAVRAKWKCVKWLAVHVLTCVVIACSIPHQCSSGRSFSGASASGSDTCATA